MSVNIFSVKKATTGAARDGLGTAGIAALLIACVKLFGVDLSVEEASAIVVGAAALWRLSRAAWKHGIPSVDL